MDEHRRYLAENIISGEKVITYRFLSRVLKVHVNTAKQMLYGFHKWQNGKRPGAVYATYLLYGTKKEDQGVPQSQASQADGDIDMMSSPMPSSAPEPEQTEDVVSVYSLCLVPEDELKAVLETYEEVKSIHIYSLGPHPTKDMALLSDAARQVFTISTPGESLRIFGTITNTNVRRRERKGPGLKAAAAATAATKVGVKPAAKPATVPSMVKQESFDAKTPTPPPSASTSSGAAKKPKPAPKGGAFSIMQSFAKGAATAKTKKAETSQPATPSGDDSSIHPMSEGEEDDSAFLPKPKAAVVSGRKTKAQQREEQLKAMMEEEDEEEPEEREDTPMEEPVEEEPAPEPEKAEPEPAEVVSASGDGRRRGRRKIMKKRRFLDEEGQLVTVTEPAWEEFSEDEAPPPVIAKTSSSAPAAPAAKGKKAAGAKGGQGSIMSFFNKK